MSDFFSGGFYHFKKLKKPRPEAITQQEIFDLGATHLKGQDRAMLYFLYLTGARISEALRVQVRDVSMTDVDLPTGRQVRCIGVNLMTLKKRRGIPRRTVYINISGLDYEMYKVINEIRNSRPMQDSFIFEYGDISESTKKARDIVYQRMRKVKYVVNGIMPPDGRSVVIHNFHLFNHYMRHCRAYHLKSIYRLNGDEARAFFGWSSSALWDNYGQETSVDVLTRLVGRDGGISTP